MDNPNRLTHCAVSGCNDFHMSRRKFPNPAKDMNGFKKWLKLCQNKLLECVPPANVYKSHSICDRHFLRECISRNNRLFPNAIPSLHLPNAGDIESHPSTSLSQDETQVPHEQENVTEVSPSDATKASVIDVIEKAVPVNLTKGSCELNLLFKSPDAESHANTCQGSITQVVTPHLKRRSTVLSSLSVSREIHLTPRNKTLFKRVKYLKRSLQNCRRKSATFRSRLNLAKKNSALISLDELEGKTNHLVAGFFECQIRNFERNPHGRRFTLDDELLALSFCKQSGRAYRHWSKLFALPSKSSIHKILNQIKIGPGFNEAIFENLQRCAKKLREQDKLCILLFDEMAIKPNLQYNSYKDLVEGFCDTGSERTIRIADHVLVFMIRGITKNYKQAIWYSYCEGSTKTADLVKVIKEVVGYIQRKTSLKIIATVCDQGATKVAAINSLIKKTKEDHIRSGNIVYEDVFEVNDLQIIPLYDPPHLLKGIRNNFLNKSIIFEEKGIRCTAKWDYIVDAYKVDASAGRFKYFKKIHDKHIFEQKMNKMKVSHAAQIFSETVATGLSRMAKDGFTSLDGRTKVPPEAEDTTKLLVFFNDLFDSVNGGSKKYSENGLRTLVTPNSRHLLFWNDCLKRIEKIRFLNKNNREVIPPSLKHWAATIKNFKLLRSRLLNSGIKKFSSRAFNQDPLENLFGQIRQQGALNINPTAFSFGPYYKSVLIKTFTSAHSIGANCEEDDFFPIFDNLKQFIKEKYTETSNFEVKALAIENNSLTFNDIDNNVISYIGGFVIKNILPKIDCDVCKGQLTTDHFETFHVLTEIKDHRAKLNYCSARFFDFLKRVYILTLNLLPNMAFQNNVIKVLHKTLKDHNIDTVVINCNAHVFLNDEILHKFLKFIIFNYFNTVSNIINGKTLNIDLNDNLQILCLEKYNKSCKYKNKIKSKK